MYDTTGKRCLRTSLYIFLIVSGTLRERGIRDPSDGAEKNKYEHEEFLTTESGAYDLPYIDAIRRRLPFLKYLPFIQPINDSSKDNLVK